VRAGLGSGASALPRVGASRIHVGASWIQVGATGAATSRCEARSDQRSSFAPTCEASLHRPAKPHRTDQRSL